ncbi:hypothetical protein K502DRAFT_331948, partial [Neoconidiobolus thromboides FSU 785]
MKSINNPLIAALLGALAVSAKGYYDEANCPLDGDTCTLNGSTYNYDMVGGPECWMEGDANWSCSFIGKDGMCAEGYSNVKEECEEPMPACPPRNSADIECTTNSGGKSSFYDYGDNVCWKKSGRKWKCGPKTNDKCAINEKDISTCPKKYIKPTPPPCPPKEKPETTCTGLDGKTHTFGKTDGNDCWGGKADAYTCRAPVKGVCSTGEINITTCPQPTKPPTCPPADSYYLKCDDGAKGSYFGEPGNN